MNLRKLQDLTLCMRDLNSFCHYYGRKNPDFDVSAAVISLAAIGSALLSEQLEKME
jgi:hypothetical protein